MPTAWENKIVKYSLKWKGFDYSEIEEELNALGQEGWEVVQSMIPTVGSGQALELALILKRPLQG